MLVQANNQKLQQFLFFDTNTTRCILIWNKNLKRYTKKLIKLKQKNNNAKDIYIRNLQNLSLIRYHIDPNYTKNIANKLGKNVIINLGCQNLPSLLPTCLHTSCKLNSNNNVKPKVTYNVKIAKNIMHQLHTFTFYPTKPWLHLQMGKYQ